MRELELSYIGGIIGGEGYIGICKFNWPEYRKPYGHINPEYAVYIQVGMKDAEAVKLIHRLFGGCLKYGKKEKLWRWVVSKRKAQQFLSVIYPYLRVKKDAARNALKFLRLKSIAINRNRNEGNKYISKYEELYGVARAINRK